MDRRDLEHRHRMLGHLARLHHCYAMKLAGTRLKHHPSRKPA
jgi:hypothetical protein